MRDDKSTLVIPTLLDRGETSGNSGETWPKQRQQNLKIFQVYSSVTIGEMKKRKKPCPQQLVQHRVRLDKHASFHLQTPHRHQCERSTTLVQPSPAS